MLEGLHCWFGRHDWAEHETSAGEHVKECTHCGKRVGGGSDDDGDIGVPGKWVGGGLGPWGIPGGH
jgi:hypothetical protein